MTDLISSGQSDEALSYSERHALVLAICPSGPNRSACGSIGESECHSPSCRCALVFRRTLLLILFLAGSKRPLRIMGRVHSASQVKHWRLGTGRAKLLEISPPEKSDTVEYRMDHNIIETRRSLLSFDMMSSVLLVFSSFSSHFLSCLD